MTGIKYYKKKPKTNGLIYFGKSKGTKDYVYTLKNVLEKPI